MAAPAARCHNQCMPSEYRHSDRSGELLDASAETQVTYMFDDGHRRSVSLTAREAHALRSQGEDRTSLWSRLVAWVPSGGIARWILALAIAGLYTEWISDSFSDWQREVELESQLMVQVTKAASEAYVDSLAASRVESKAKAKRLSQATEDRWIVASGSIVPFVEAWYPKDSAVRKNWSRFQDAMYQWTRLACCLDEDGRSHALGVISGYLTDYGDVGRNPPDEAERERWDRLETTDRPPPETYESVGKDLISARVGLFQDLRVSEPRLD